jgi:AraC-like DNA-binding protein
MAQSKTDRLAYLGFRLIPPSRLLSPYVRSYWYFRRETFPGAYHEEFMHPTGGYGLLFNFGDRLRLDARPLTDPVSLDGTNTVSRKMGFGGRVDVLGVRFHEGAAYPFLGIPLNELRDAPSLLDAWEGRDLPALYARLHEAPSLAARIDLLEEWLAGRLVLGRVQNPLVPASIGLLRDNGRRLTIPELAGELAIGQRQLERLYQAQVGMPPRHYARLLRVDRARLALKELNGQTTNRLAADLGYYDQPHFIREFSAVVGMTPIAYLRRSRDK